jgi:hypothetical protein
LVIVCARCKQTKPEGDFYTSTKKGHHSYCKICCAEVYQINRERFLKKQKKRREDRRAICLEHFGNKCDCCGESTPEFMSIDHINGDGARHRKEINRASMYHWLIQNNFPKGFRLLCHNCNQSLSAYGYCPHQKEWASA